jgi:hypothetical protein
MKNIRLGLLAGALCLVAYIPGTVAADNSPQRSPEMTDQHCIFATFAGYPGQLPDIVRQAESLREFGGRFADSPVWLVAPEDLEISGEWIDKLAQVGVELHRSKAPEAARQFFYGDKVYAAAAAEQAAQSKAAILVWIDPDTIFLGEPSEVELKSGQALAYCPVMHNRSGTPYGAEPDEFWSRIYELLELSDDQLFPMVTPADQQKIRAYFHCGLLSLRPERGILRRWAEDFERLYTDSAIIAMCQADRTRAIFLHQTPLTGAILHLVQRNEMAPFSEAYNYPIFFKRHWGGLREYDDIRSAVMLRVVIDFSKVGPDWDRELKGPPEKIAWLKGHIRTDNIY